MSRQGHKREAHGPRQMMLREGGHRRRRGLVGAALYNAMHELHVGGRCTPPQPQLSQETRGLRRGERRIRATAKSLASGVNCIRCDGALRSHHGAFGLLNGVPIGGPCITGHPTTVNCCYYVALPTPDRTFIQVCGRRQAFRGLVDWPDPSDAVPDHRHDESHPGALQQYVW